MASDKMLIRNGRIIDPANKLDAVGDLMIESGRVTRVGGKIADGQADTIDAAGCIVCPGLIDIHVHFREPGEENGIVRLT